MRPWSSATRCVDSRGSCLPGAQEGPAVRRSGRNTHGGGSLTAAGGRERARRPVGDTVSGCGCGGWGLWAGWGELSAAPHWPPFPLARPPMKTFLRLGIVDTPVPQVSTQTLCEWRPGAGGGQKCCQDSIHKHSLRATVCWERLRTGGEAGDRG